MGALYQLDVKKFVEEYNLTNYVETGTGEGVCLSHALTFNFNKLYSVEIYKQIYEQAVEKFKNNENTTILEGNSYEVLPSILPKLKGNTLFWLDAHFPGVDFHYQNYGDTKDYDTRLPLEREVRTIVKSRDVSKDVFLIDDLRVYEDNNYSNGNWPHRKSLGGDGIGFIYDLLGDTHNIEKDLDHQGFLIITPK